MQQLRKRVITSGCLVLLLGLFACRRPEPLSPIVEKVERAGSGNLATVSKMVFESGSASTKKWPIR